MNATVTTPLNTDVSGEDEWTPTPLEDAAMWAYQYTGALTVAAFDEKTLRPGDFAPLMDLLSALAEGEVPTVAWPAVVPSLAVPVLYLADDIAEDDPTVADQPVEEDRP